MYNLLEFGQDIYEFIEVYNNGVNVVNMLGYSFINGVEYIFILGFNFGVGEYVFFVIDSVVFVQVFGFIVFQIINGSLSNGGELIIFFDDQGVVVDEVDYDDSFLWVSEVDGFGFSLVFCDFDSDNNDGFNWDNVNIGIGVIFGGLEMFVNLGLVFECLSGVEVCFLSVSQEVGEDVGMVIISVEISNVVISIFSVDVVVNNMMLMVIFGDDVIGMVIIILNFNSGDVVDIMDVVIMIVDDSEVEFIESLVFELVNFLDGVFINVVGGCIDVLIVDNDVDIVDIVIIEIMYSFLGIDSDNEYLEFYNNDIEVVNLEGYYFGVGIDDILYNVMLMFGDYLVLVVDSVIFEGFYGVVVFQWISGGLSNGGEIIELCDLLGNVVDEVFYDDIGDWFEEVDGSGVVLVFCDLFVDNSMVSSWIVGV